MIQSDGMGREVGGHPPFLIILGTGGLDYFVNHALIILERVL